MMNGLGIELRWVVPEGTTTEQPILQYRRWNEWPRAAGPWLSVKVHVVPDREFRAALASHKERVL